MATIRYITLLMAVFSVVWGYSLDDQLRLITDVVERRSGLAKADPLAGRWIDVNLWFNLLFILDLDERRQILTTSGWMDLWWYDRRYAWNSSQYGGIEVVMVANSLIWKPDIVVRNAVNSFNIIGSDDDHIKVYSSGDLQWSPANIYETICDVDVRTFPFDSQTCHMNVSSWMYYEDQLHLSPYGKGVVLRHYKANSEWELKELDSQRTFYNYSDGFQNGFTIKFKLKRHSTFYVLKIMVPTVMLSLLNAFVFAVPVESGERVSISVTTMLSLTVFLSYIGDVTPNNSDNIPVIALFVVLHLSLGALSIICNIITLNYHFKWQPKESEKSSDEHISMKRVSVIKHLFRNLDIDDKDSASSNEITHNRISESGDEITAMTRKKPERKLKFEYLDKVFFVVFIAASLSITLLAVFSMVSVNANM